MGNDQPAFKSKTETPFDRFKAIASAVFQTPKSSLPKVSKKSKRKK